MIYPSRSNIQQSILLSWHLVTQFLRRWRSKVPRLPLEPLLDRVPSNLSEISPVGGAQSTFGDTSTDPSPPNPSQASTETSKGPAPKTCSQRQSDKLQWYGMWEED